MKVPMIKHESQSHDPTAAVGLFFSLGAMSVMAVRPLPVDIAVHSH